jgi:hypothetical protein
MDQVAGPTWQKMGEMSHSGMRPDATGCVATSVRTSGMRA